jgi:tryptophan-rich sensory protein
VVVTLLAVIALFWRIRRVAGLLLLPYLAWACFATALNYQFIVENPDGGARDLEGGAVERIEL